MKDLNGVGASFFFLSKAGLNAHLYCIYKLKMSLKSHFSF